MSKTYSRESGRVLDSNRVIDRLEKSYKGFERSVTSWEDDLNGTRIRVSAEDGLADRNGNLLFDIHAVGGIYTFGVIGHLHRWLDRNGWSTEWINNGEIHLWKKGHNGW